MGDSITIRLTEKLRRFVEEKGGPNGLYGSTSEYVRDLIRRDLEAEEERRWTWLSKELKAGIEAPEEDYQELDMEEFLKEARLRKAQSNAG